MIATILGPFSEIIAALEDEKLAIHLPGNDPRAHSLEHLSN